MSNNKDSIKVYVDSCILSKLVCHATEEEQQKALDKICDYGCIKFVTSSITLEEFNKTPQAHIRVALRVYYKLINEIPNVNFIKFKDGWSFPWSFPKSFGTAVEDELYKKLKKIFKNGDEVHIYNAIKADCKYFLTLDYKTILDTIKKDRVLVEIKEICSDLEFVDPKKLLEKMI